VSSSCWACPVDGRHAFQPVSIHSALLFCLCSFAALLLSIWSDVRLSLSSTAVVEGDIFHRTLAIEENARFEGMSRRQENTTHTLSSVAHPQVVPIDDNRKGNGAPVGLNT
jgi:hypothetical protein